MSSKSGKKLVKFLEEIGYSYDRTNAKSMHMYVLDGFPDIGVNPSIDEHAAVSVTRNVQKMHGIDNPRAKSKRNAAAVKERQAHTREQIAAQVEASKKVLADLRNRRDAELGGLGAHLTAREVQAIARHIEREEAELRRWQALMTEAPSNNAHSGRETARHRS